MPTYEMRRDELVCAFRTYTDDDPFQAYIDRVMRSETQWNPEEDPTPDEAVAMLNAMHKMLPRLSPTAYGLYLDLQAELLAVLAETGWPAE